VICGRLSQLGEHRRTNGLCFKCRDKYAHGHKCSETASDISVAQLASMTGNSGDGGRLLSDEMLSALEMHSATTEEDCFFSLNAISGPKTTD
jgi:hypothetical protein